MPRRLACGAAALAALGIATAASGQSVESAVKAAFLPKFAPYVTWPPGPAQAGPIRLCIVGADPFAAMADEAAAGVKVDQRALAVERPATAEAARSCQIVFVGGSPRQNAGAMLAALRGAPVLTVTDDRIAPQRGIIHFVLAGGRVRFVIDDALAAEGRLTISAKLLSLAVNVKQRSPR